MMMRMEMMTIALMPLTSHQCCIGGGWSKPRQRESNQFGHFWGLRSPHSSGLTVETRMKKDFLAFLRWTICFTDSSHHASSTSSMFSSSRFIAMIYCVHRCISNIGWGHTLWMASTHAGLDCHTKPTTLNTEHFSASHYTIHTQHCILHTLHLTWHMTHDKSVLFFLGGAKF